MNSFTPRASRNRHRPGRFTPRLEALSDRIVPAASKMGDTAIAAHGPDMEVVRQVVEISEARPSGQRKAAVPAISNDSERSLEILQPLLKTYGGSDKAYDYDGDGDVDALDFTTFRKLFSLGA